MASSLINLHTVFVYHIPKEKERIFQFSPHFFSYLCNKKETENSVSFLISFSGICLAA